MALQQQLHVLHCDVAVTASFHAVHALAWCQMLLIQITLVTLMPRLMLAQPLQVSCFNLVLQLQLACLRNSVSCRTAPNKSKLN